MIAGIINYSIVESYLYNYKIIKEAGHSTNLITYTVWTKMLPKLCINEISMYLERLGTSEDLSSVLRFHFW